MIKIRYNAPVTLTFCFISLLVLLSDKWTNGWTTMHLFCVYRSSFTDPLMYPRMFLHVLGHSGWEHYMNNILMMLVIGPTVEEKYGSKSLLSAMVVTAFISGLVQFIFFPESALLGASGIVYMLIVISSLGGLRAREIPLSLIFVMVFYLGGEIVNAFAADDNISQLTHIIGGLCGAAFGYYMAGHKNHRRRA